MGFAWERRSAGYVWNGDGDLVRPQVADGLFRILRFRRGCFAGTARILGQGQTGLQELTGGTTSMKRKWNSVVIIAALCVATLSAAQKQNDEELLSARETVWRAWFAGDTKTLEELVPPETIVMSGGEEKWKNQADVLRSAVQFHAKGGKLLRLEFPRTEVQHFGDVAIIWSSYVVETEVGGKRSSGSSRVTEIFVRQHGHWINPGWHTDEEK